MPCNCDHLMPNQYEKESSKVACFLDEIDGKPFNENHWSGNHPKAYGHSKSDCDALTSELCKHLQKNDVSQYSLEMQIWWRDHKKADKKRITKELEEKKKKSDRKKLLNKLSDYEKELLGL